MKVLKDKIKRNAPWEQIPGRSKGSKVPSSCSAHLSSYVSCFRRLRRLYSQHRSAHKAKRGQTASVTMEFNTKYENYVTQKSRVLLEKLTGPQLVKKFPAFYGTRRFITAFTRARLLFLSRARLMQSMPPSHFLKTPF
jgi:hypothetical protein